MEVPMAIRILILLAVGLFALGEVGLVRAQTVTGAWSKPTSLPDAVDRQVNLNAAVTELQAEHGVLVSPYQVDASTNYYGPVSSSASTNIGNMQSINATDGSLVQFSGQQSANNANQGANASGNAGSGTFSTDQINTAKH